MSFKPIETQEQFDAAIRDRLQREQEKYEGFLSPADVEAKYKGYLSPEDEKTKYEGFMSKEDVEAKYKGYISPEEAAKKDAQIKQNEQHSVKMRIAKDMGLNMDAVDFLKGETEEEIKKSAETLKALVGSGKRVPPLADPNIQPGDPKDEALRTLLKGMKGE